MEPERIDVDEEAERILPLDGPYTREGIKDTVALIAELVRHLNHATMAGTVKRLAPIDVDSIVVYLGTAMAGLPQLLRQLSQITMGHAADPKLRADGLARQGWTPEMMAQVAADLLRDDAAASTVAAHTALSTARSFTARLYLDRTGEK